METKIQVICCVCGKDMGTKDGKGKTGISHAYCPACLKAALKEIENGKST